MTAGWDFTAINHDDLNMKKGDQVQVLELDPTGDWTLVRNTTTKKEGYVPTDYLTKPS
jgi:hypothetical protein